MKEIKLQFETEELYNRFINNIINPTLRDQQEFPDQLNTMKLEYDFNNDLGIIKG